jgi:RHS repeat-associated protein
VSFPDEKTEDKTTMRCSNITGKERDSESGLDNFGARYNSSSMGRFMSPDPLLSSGRIANPQTWNRYAYALNNPLRIVDPTGLYDWDESAGGDMPHTEAT